MQSDPVAAGGSASPPLAAGPEIVGREAELRQIRALIEDASETARAVLLEGEPGIGKTTLWSAGVRTARDASHRVLVCRPAETETALPFAALGDLLEPVLTEALPSLPEPQRLALEVALQLAPPLAKATEQLAVSRAFLAILRTPAGRATTVAVDDVQWLDPATAAVLEFAARRATGLPIRFLLARRTERDLQPSGLVTALDGVLEAVRLGPLAPGDLDHLLRSRLELRLPRPRLIELSRVSGGNPFYALEIARSSRAGEFSLPDSLTGLLRERLGSLSPGARDAILLAAAAAQPTTDLVTAAAAGTEGLAEAVGAGVLGLEGRRIRFTHPLLASAAYESAPPWELREAHRRLAEAASDDEERARHLALCTDEADEAIAAELERAAGLAAARGAPESAGALAEHAARLTPSDRDSEHRRRLTEAAEHHIASGDPARGRSILEELIAGLSPGPERADLLWRLADAVGDDLPESIRLCEQALGEAGDDPALGARIHTALGVFTWIGGDLVLSTEHVRASSQLAEVAGDRQLVAVSLGELCHAETVLGRGYRPDEMERALQLEREIDTFPPFMRPSYQLGLISLFTDEHETARPLLLAELERVETTGDEAARWGVLFRLLELELRAGNWEEAARLGRESLALVLQAGIEQEQGIVFMGHGLVQAHLGNITEALDACETSRSLAAAGGDRMVGIRALGALGFAELSRGDPEAALAYLSPARAELETLGVGELSITQVAHNEIEALIGLGRLDEAEPAIDFVDEKGKPTGRSWHRVVAERGRAFVAAGRGDYDTARVHLQLALEAHERLPQPFELGRTLLAQGSIERRAKHRAAAREALTRALELFDTLGAALWAEKAAAELARIPGRAPSSGELGETERRIAELVADGLTNKEVAAKLFVTVRTVEANLTKAYAKLGVRSRTELVGRLKRAPDA